MEINLRTFFAAIIYAGLISSNLAFFGQTPVLIAALYRNKVTKKAHSIQKQHFRTVRWHGYAIIDFDESLSSVLASKQYLFPSPLLRIYKDQKDELPDYGTCNR